MVLAETTVLDMDFRLALGAYRRCVRPARKRGPDKAPNNSSLPAPARDAELACFPDFEQGTQLEIERDERPCDVDLPCGGEPADIAAASLQQVMGINVRVAGRRDNFILMPHDEVKVLVEQIVLAFEPLFLDIEECLLVLLFLFLDFSDKEQASLLALAELREPFSDDLGHKNLLF